MGQLLEFSNIKFRFGPREVSLNDLLDTELIHKIEKAFPNTETSLLYTRVRETLRFLYIATFSPESIFFPGDEEMGAIWHELIIDTRGYRRLCNDLKAGSFIDHWGVSYKDYAAARSSEILHQERLSWLASYFHNFGDIENPTLKILPLAQSLCENLAVDLYELNRFAENITKLSFGKVESSVFDFQKFIAKEVVSQAIDLDKSYYVVKSVIQNLMAGLRISSKRSPLLLTNDELELIFSESTSLGFTLGSY